MKAFKVYTMDKMGYDDKVVYYKKQKEAEKDFYQRVREGISNENLIDKDYGEIRPWKINLGHDFLKSNIILSAYFNYWDSYYTDCGTEHDIDRYEVCLEEIEIQ